jgi:RNA polymerase sigma-70 factor, ECF subfamily
LTDRTNNDWLRMLSETGPTADAAIAELREVIRRGLHKALRGHPGADDALIEDVTQESVLKVLDGLSGFRGDSKLTTWAVTVAVRVAFSELRRARWRDVSLDGLTEGGLAPEPAATSAPSAQTERDELIARMRHVIDTELSERQRFLLVAELNGVPQAELCERLGLNRNALYKLGHDARQKLKRGLLASGVTEDDVREVFAITS